ncbi:MAG: flagellar hook-length control protein FliK [Chloroflexi bacterium]|nr:flagellar hook-length control protein FliK [Chloroflexota bacterium]
MLDAIALPMAAAPSASETAGPLGSTTNNGPPFRELLQASLASLEEPVESPSGSSANADPSALAALGMLFTPIAPPSTNSLTPAPPAPEGEAVTAPAITTTPPQPAAPALAEFPTLPAAQPPTVAGTAGRGSTPLDVNNALPATPAATAPVETVDDPGATSGELLVIPHPLPAPPLATPAPMVSPQPRDGESTVEPPTAPEAETPSPPAPGVPNAANTTLSEGEGDAPPSTNSLTPVWGLHRAEDTLPVARGVREQTEAQPQALGVRYRAETPPSARGLRQAGESPPGADPAELPDPATSALHVGEPARLTEAHNTDPAGSPSLVAQIGNAVETTTRSGQASLRLALFPESLGRVDLRLTASADGLRVTLTADLAATGNLLERHLDDLRRALADSGLNVASISVGLGERQGFGANAQPNGQPFGFEWQGPPHVPAPQWEGIRPAPAPEPKAVTPGVPAPGDTGSKVDYRV